MEIEDENFITARNQAYKYLGQAARTYAETYEKLKKREYSEEVIDKVMKFLQKNDYINDEVYAEEYVRAKVKYKGYGKGRIGYDLRRKGVSADIVATALESYPEDETEMAVAQINKRLRGREIEDQKEKRRLIAFLMRKGYSYPVASKAMSVYADSEME